ncbi:MarR family EPS-associated transcriptional regulator [Planktomarina sp.]|nr:MarR family EPS-associated transcriptional regulator [Planktomarina sp.]
MASRREEHQEDVRLRVMCLIDENSEMSSRQIADKVGIANGSAYYVLTALIEKGFVKLENFKNSQRKAQYAYLLTPSGIREKSLLTHRFIGRKRQEFVALRAEIESLEKEVGLAKDLSSSESSVK